MHTTNNLNDGYLGSGTRLRYSVKKYGIENHKLEILEFLPDRSSLKNKEKEIVNEELIKDPLCMNLKEGGEGGFTIEQQKINGLNGRKKMKWLWKNDENWKNNLSSKRSSYMFQSYQTGIRIPNPPDWTWKKHKEETKEKMRNHKGKQKGSKNSQYGTCWITNGTENKKIQKNNNIPDGWKLGRKIF